MGSSLEATNVVLARIKNLEPDNASKIMGFLLINLNDSDILRLASCPDHVLQSLVIRVKTHMGFSLSSPPPSLHINPITKRPIFSNNNNPFSKSIPSSNGGGGGFDFNANFNHSPLSPQKWKLSGYSSNPICPISPNSSPLLSYDNIRTASSFSPRVNVNGDCEFNNASDFVDEHQVNEYFPFLNESSKNDDDPPDPRIEMGGLGGEVNNWNSNGDTHSLHRRSFSANDAFFACEEGIGSGIRNKPCLYFARGFCKNGSNCKFVHSGLTDSLDATSSGGVIAGSPSNFDGLEQREEFMRLKAAQHQKFLAASQIMAGASSPSSYDNYIDFLMQQQNDPQRAAAVAAFMMGEESNNFRLGRLERNNDFLAMALADKPNSASRQIYLTFPAESTFRDEDVSEYFSKFGPVQDVRIPYQQKRMFGFVSFAYPETVRLILSKGNPHFICDSRVLVKPYKEKGKILDKRLQQLERGDFSPRLSPSGFESKEPYDFHLGARMLYTPRDILMRRKFEEQAELQQAIELQARRLVNLRLPDFKNNPIHHHQRSLSVGAPFPFPSQLHSHISNTGHSSDSINGDITGYSDSLTSTISLGTAPEHRQMQLPPQEEVDTACIGDTVDGKGKESANAEVTGPSNRSVEQSLPDSLFASPTKAAGHNLSDFSTSAETIESDVFSTSSYHKLELQPTTSNDMASH
ncbi:PREDICTED: zinc finger CCCH domain-containing protein 55-like isoform X1 [Lupinus angustifolius]|uniref:zinc finger CCCH domain-containing protein 55-like isoform X1 n=2 Tax=Lupinus angustifolius TaxID=3871 RepID=UPI00092F3162|nr:PREDICTED: zinc finger CCCH domain-containing protein 55-like isoform X1 [Lupinus angustifolius]XP_019421991.1 PREDICTED: zinc finger CCCH domain-containing protein 55-like isoform X1 [Lupinus angustifolius]XP_019421992.1 PREDICTED: zinc finger CCCH domain-containing protein 55-like isoform X1 [Lupinus angustifolius]XP_019421993.1 PREDICTED: zinc finger CCCH domain-containing protein 55-like isoform X1 [Lupinus angustifolius]